MFDLTPVRESFVNAITTAERLMSSAAMTGDDELIRLAVLVIKAAGDALERFDVEAVGPDR